MRKLYIDNIRWITVVLVVLYHVIKKGRENCWFHPPLGF